MLAKGLADVLGLRVGSTLAVQPQSAREVRFRVVGVVRALEDEGRVAFVRLARLEAALGTLEPPAATGGAQSEGRIAVAAPKPPPGAGVRPVEPSGRASSSKECPVGYHLVHFPSCGQPSGTCPD